MILNVDATSHCLRTARVVRIKGHVALEGILWISAVIQLLQAEQAASSRLSNHAQVCCGINSGVILTLDATSHCLRTARVVRIKGDVVLKGMYWIYAVS